MDVSVCGRVSSASRAIAISAKAKKPVIVPSQNANKNHSVFIVDSLAMPTCLHVAEGTSTTLPF